MDSSDQHPHCLVHLSCRLMKCWLMKLYLMDLITNKQMTNNMPLTRGSASLITDSPLQAKLSLFCSTLELIEHHVRCQVNQGFLKLLKSLYIDIFHSVWVFRSLLLKYNFTLNFKSSIIIRPISKLQISSLLYVS